MGPKRGATYKPTNAVTTCGDLVVMELTRGQSAIVDACDYPLVAGMRWAATPVGELWYAKATVRMPDGRRTGLMMHRAILGLSVGDNIKVDHIDGNGLNNARSNLRLATTSQNAMNRRKRKAASSRFKGVSLHAGGLWRAQICVNGQPIQLGYHCTEEEAALAYNEAAIKHHGGFACLNIIN